MPIYEYQCTECGHALEALQKIADPVLTECPNCGASALQKKVSAPSFRLAGQGWYETDFKTGSKKNLAGEGATDKGAGNSDGSSSSDGAASKKESGGSDKAASTSTSSTSSTTGSSKASG